MSSAMMMERPMGTMFSPGMSSAPAQPMTNWCVTPRCTFKVEKCKDGMKLYCKCDDEIACGTLQNLCKMLCDGMCSCCCMCNGLECCKCSFANCHCKCEMTKDGCCITCTSGDKQCCEMLQACCDCCMKCCENGCCCYVCFNNTPVCCGTC